jgi:hypothetical protein
LDKTDSQGFTAEQVLQQLVFTVTVVSSRMMLIIIIIIAIIAIIVISSLIIIIIFIFIIFIIIIFLDHIHHLSLPRHFNLFSCFISGRFATTTTAVIVCSRYFTLATRQQTHNTLPFHFLQDARQRAEEASFSSHASPMGSARLVLFEFFLVLD